MGQITLTVEVANQSDVDLAEAGHMPHTAVRRTVIEGVLADTGATHLSLPLDLIEQLGLRKLDDIVVSTAMGEARTGLYQAVLTISGRTRPASCVALPQGRPPLLGAIPMEDLGIELDLRDRTFRLLPDDSRNTYFRV